MTCKLPLGQHECEISPTRCAHPEFIDIPSMCIMATLSNSDIVSQARHRRKSCYDALAAHLALASPNALRSSALTAAHAAAAAAQLCAAAAAAHPSQVALPEHRRRRACCAASTHRPRTCGWICIYVRLPVCLCVRVCVYGMCVLLCNYLCFSA